MKRLILVVISMFLCTSMFAQDGNNELLKDVQAKYNSIKSLSVNFTKSGGKSEGFSGKLYLKKENKLKIELKNNTIVTDGETFWNYNKKEKKVIINNYDAEDPSELSLNSFINDYPSKSTVSEGKEGDYYTLTLVPKTNELNFSKAVLYIDDNNLVDKVEIENGQGRSTIVLSDYKLNTDIPDSEFTFSPPKGIKVIDLR